MSKPKHPHHSPPRWPDKLLEWFCAPELLEEVLGDLHERYYLKVQKVGETKARREYWREVLAYLRPAIIKRPSIRSITSISPDMLRNYFKIAFRNIIRSQAFSAINILGLALGMTCFLFIFLWVQDERSVDNFHENRNLYNLYQTTYAPEGVDGQYTTPVRYTDNRRHVLLEDIQESIPEIERINFYATGYELPWGHPETFQVGKEIHKLEGSRAGADFFSMFNYPLIAGSEENALKEINSIAISRTMAALFFKSPEKAIGKSIRYENQFDLVITAVFEDVTAKSSLQFDFLLNWDFHNQRGDGWASHVILTTLQLADNADVERVESNINRFIQPYLDQDESVKIEVGLQPFRDKYLVSNFENGKPNGGRIEYIHIFSSVAIFILIIACINFMNLSTAQATKRAKEVGVRKVIGSSRKYLVGQFLGESILLAFLSLLLSLMLIQLLLPSFNQFTGKQVSLSLSEPAYWAVLVGLMLITGFFAGSYPALYLASLKPVQVLKGNIRFTRFAIWFRKGLVVFQFSLSILLLIGTLIVTRQTNYVQNSHLGYDRENLIYIRTEGELTKQPKYDIFKNEASKLPGVALVDRSIETPHAMGFEIAGPIDWEGKQEGTVVSFKPFSVGFDFTKIMKLEIVEGRDFSRQIATDSAEAFMVNEEAVKQMGMKDPIGKWVSAWDKKGRIIGILKDYHTHSLHESIKPIIVDVKEYEYFGVVLIRTEPGKTREALAALENVYQEINPNYPFDYQFLDQEYAKLYQSEQVIAKLSNVFALLAIVVSCLGLLGLAIFSAEQRIKEIGIRKVLGASVSSIVTLFSKDFLQLVGISFMVAAPLSWFFSREWLQSFAYRIAIQWWIFAAAGLLVLLVALLTVSWQSIKAALANPVDSLRNE
ncbi:MAG: permease prefix domain 2-containing transporter [Cyclobacteriaceae bacterium]